MATVHFGRLLGEAGFARTVAIKRLHPHLAEDPAFCASIIDEARLAARIHHPNVVQTLDVVAHEKELLLVMEYVRGESLAQAMQAVVARGERVPVPIVSAIAIGALAGLHAAHEATSDFGKPLGIVHRDVSPQNILIGTDGLPRLIDFGVAKAAGRLQTTREGVVKGKFAYMAPEQLAARLVTRTADVYAMGVVVWEMLACRRLIDSEDEAAMMGSLLAGPREPPSLYAPGLSPALDALVMKALAPEASDRFSSAGEMAEALASIAPPALAAELGAWCADVAKESLAKRAAAVAEIESGAASEATEATEASLATAANDGRAELGHDDDVAPTIASQPASAALGTPPPAGHPPRRGGLVVGLTVGALLALGLITFMRWGRSSTPPSQEESPATSAAAGLVPELEASDGSASLAATAATAISPPAISPSAISPSAISPPASARPSAALPRSGNVRSSPPSSPRPSVTCNPPYFFDAQGNKKWKRQCL
jgi:serine/threonine protein kinase